MLMSIGQAAHEWLRKARSVVSFRAFDASNAHGRSWERYRRAALSTGAAFGARGIQILTSMVTVPLTLHYLGLERYGMWMTISSTIAMFTFADLGIGNGLVNAIADAHGRNDRQAAAKYVSSAFYALIAVGGIVGLTFAACYPFVAWARVFNVSSPEAVAEAGPAVAVFVASFVVSMPLGIVQRIRMGYQEGFIDSAWTTVGSLGAFVAVLVGVKLRASLPWLVFSMAAVPAAVQVVNAAVLFGRHSPWLRPRQRLVDRVAVSRVMRTGGYFFILQVAAAVAYQSDSLILAQMLGPESVTRYSVPMKLFQLTPMILGFAFAALWPAYAEATARGDVQWARKTLNRSLILSFAIALPISGCLVVFGQPIIEWWVGPAVVPDYLVLVAMGTWAVVGAVSGSLGAFLNGSGILRFQAIAAVLMMLANVGFSILLTRVLGLSGVVWGSVLSQVVCILAPLWIYLHYRFRRERIDQ